MLKKLSLIALVIGMTGCASQFGNQFNGSGLMTMQPGVTTRAEALALIASVPQNSDTVTFKKDGAGKDLAQPVVMERMYYYFRDNRAAGTPIDPEAKRYAWLSFSGDKLLSYSVASTFRDDSTDFDEAAVNKLQKGKTTEQEALSLMGRPSGRAIYPVARDVDGSRLYYQVRWWANHKMHSKTLRIDFDKSHVLSDFDLNISAD